MRGQRRCTWCGDAYPVRGHGCAVGAAPPPMSPSQPRGPIRREKALPRYDRNNGLGSMARAIVITELGWSMLSPEVLRRIAAGKRV